MFNLRNFNAVYYPAKSNEPLNIKVKYNLNGGENYPVTVSGKGDAFALDGKYHEEDENPVLFPYTNEWYNKLKVAYPNLRPYEPDYHSVIKSILANSKTVVCQKSSISHQEAIKNSALFFVDSYTQLIKDTYYVAVNPFTLEVCESDADYFTIPNINIPFQESTDAKAQSN